MSQMAAVHPQSDGFLVHVAPSLLGDEEPPAIEVIHQDDAVIKSSSFSERTFYRSLVFAVDTLASTTEENVAVDREIVAFLLRCRPLHSIDSMTLLLNHIYQVEVRMEASSSGKTAFIKDLENVLEGLSYMKEDEYPVPQEVTDLFRRESSPSLLEGLVVLLFAAKSQGKLDGIGDEDDTAASQEAERQEASTGTPVPSECESSAAADEDRGITKAESISPTPPTEATSYTTQTSSDELKSYINDTSHLSPREISICITHPALQLADAPTDCSASFGSLEDDTKDVDLATFRQISTVNEELLIPPLSKGSEMTEAMVDIDLGETVIGAEPAAEQDLDTTDGLQVTTSTPVLEDSFDDTTNYDEALRTIDVIRMNLQEKHTRKKENNTSKEEKDTSKGDNGGNARGVTWNDKSLLKHCDDNSTVASSLDSINLTDDESSQESKGSGFFHCAIDSMLDAVLGPPCLPYCSDSSLSSMESEESFQETIMVVHSIGNLDDTDSEHQKRSRERVPPALVQVDCSPVCKADLCRKSSLMESDFEDIKSEGASSDSWIQDVRKVETHSLTSF